MYDPGRQNLLLLERTKSIDRPYVTVRSIRIVDHHEF